MENHRRKVSRRMYSVGNYFTDVLSITYRRNLSVGKTVNSCCASSNSNSNNNNNNNNNNKNNKEEEEEVDENFEMED